MPSRLDPGRFILIHCLVWWGMMLAAKSVLDGYGDMSEVYGWSQYWLAGSDKHPQLLPWIAKLWFMVAPRTVAAFYLLSALNLAVALLGILALGRALRLSEQAVFVAVALSTLAFPYLTLAGKLNMNAICLSVWPWVAWAFVRAIDPEASEGRRCVHGALLGLFAALALLGKYYAIVLLIPLFIYALMPANRWIWRGGAPWIALGVAFVALAPHVLWLIAHREALAFAAEQGMGGGSARWLYRIAKFGMVPLIYWPIPILLACLLFARGGARARVARFLRWPAGLGLLGFLAVGPWLTTIFLSLMGLAELSTPWAIPIGFAFTLWLVANADPAALARNGARLIDAFRFVWPAMIVGGLILGAVAGWTGKEGFYRPYPEAAERLAAELPEGDPAGAPWIAKGDLAATLAFLAPRPMEALTALPDRLPSYYPEVAQWRGRTGIIACSFETGGRVDQECLDAGLGWARDNGLAGRVEIVTLRREGARFPREIPFTLAVVHVGPERPR